MKTILLKVPLVLGAATLISCLSVFMPVFVDGRSEDTVGLIYWWGFPLPFLVTASGFGWPGYKPLSFVLDVVAWTIGLWVVWQKVIQSGEKRPVEVDAEVIQPRPTLLPDGTTCHHLGEHSNYCTRCWTPLKPGVGT